MAIEYLGSDGFENGTLRCAGVDTSGSVSIVTTAAGIKTGSYCCALDTNGLIRYAVTGTPANCSVSFWLQHGADVWGYSSMYVQFILTSGEAIDIRWDGTNKTWDAYVDDVKVADGTIVTANRVIFHTQFYAVIDNAGSIGVKVGGQQSITYSGDTLPDGASAEVAYIRFWSDVNDTVVYVDDIVWGTGGYLGDCRVEWLAPTADTAQDDWSASGAGDKYADVDDIPASTVAYIYESDNGGSEELALADWTGTGKTPKLVTSWAYMKEDAATADSIKVGVDSAATEDITEHVATDTWLFKSHVMALNPADSAAWEDADIDALLWRAEAVIA